MIENDIPLDATGIDGPGTVLDLGLAVDQREHPLGGCDRLLHLGKNARQVLDRPHHEGDVRDEGLDAANGHPADFDLATAIPNNRCYG